jgi:hypothetical protein
VKVSWADLDHMTYEDVIYLNELLDSYEDAEVRAEEVAKEEDEP